MTYRGVGNGANPIVHTPCTGFPQSYPQAGYFCGLPNTTVSQQRRPLPVGRRRRTGRRSAAAEAGCTALTLRREAFLEILGGHRDRLGQRLPAQCGLERLVAVPDQGLLGELQRDWRP